MVKRSVAVCALVAGGFASCNYLDVSSEMNDGQYIEIFENANRTSRWYGEIFRSVPDYSLLFTRSAGMGNAWASHTDELQTRETQYSGKYGDWNSANTDQQRWGELYERIRQANIFLDKAHVISDPADPEYLQPTSLSPALLAEWRVNARFMRAVYHYYLMELYGPVPIVDRELMMGDNLAIPRNSLDELVGWIDAELAACIPDMVQEPYDFDPGDDTKRAVPTKGVAMAYRAKLWVYAASPLFNGGFTEALSLQNPDGKQLFPARDDGGKVAKAVQYLREFLDYAEAGRYELYVDPSGDPDLSVYNVFQAFNREIIWITSKMSWGNCNSDYGTDRYTTPRCETGGIADINIMQELVDDFYTADGYPIRETSFLPASTTYTEQGFGTWDGYEVSNMYVDREPRFYNTVTFSGKRWHVSGREVQMYKGGNADNSVGDGAPKTGYWLYKRYNRTVHNSGQNPRSYARPSIVFRLAEFHLLYAEMLNEQNPANPDVLRYLNGVRNRAGLPDIEELNPAIAGNQSMQRDAIRRESRVELATEGQRYFDVRRWMIAESPEGRQGGEFHGMNISGNKVSFHTRVVYHTRSFSRKNYLYPIPLNQIRLSEGQLVQNPGW